MVMKQFKKWWKKGYKRDIFERSDIITAKKAWRAALECMLAQETVKPLLGGSEHKYIDSIIVRKELGIE